MKFYKLNEFIVYLNIFCMVCTVWAQTTNNEQTGHTLSGNTDTLTHAITQTPKPAEYDTTHHENSSPLPELITIPPESSQGGKDITTQSSMAETTKIDDHKVVTESPESGSLSSSATDANNKSNDPQTTAFSVNELFNTNISPNPVDVSSKTPKTISFDANEELINSQTSTKEKTSHETTEYTIDTSSEAHTIASNPSDTVVKIITTTVTPITTTTSGQITTKSSDEIQTTQASVSSSTTTPVTTSAISRETSPSSSTTTTTPSPTQQTTEVPNKTTLITTSQSNSDQLYIPTITMQSDNESTQLHNSSHHDIATEYPYLNTSDLQSSSAPETTTGHSSESESKTLPDLLSLFANITEEMTSQAIETKPTESQTVTQSSETVRPIETSSTTHSPEPKVSTESIQTTIFREETEPKQTTVVVTQSPQTTPKMIEPEVTTHLSQLMNASESPEANQTQPVEENLIQTTKSDPSHGSESAPWTHPQPTDPIDAISTGIPVQPNINTLKVILPNIKHLNYINKEDMVNTVTITFTTKAVEIYRWVTIFDQNFRNFTCNCIDSERNWCSIDRVIYVSPSPLVMNNHLIVSFFVNDAPANESNTYHVYGGPMVVEALKNSTKSLEEMMGMEVLSLQTNMGTIVVKPLETSSHRLAKFELLVFIFTVVMFICTVLLCLAIICSCAKRKSVDMNQIQLNKANRRQQSMATINGFDLNSASNILRDENHEKRNHNVINLEDGWVAPIDHVIENEKITKYDNLQDTKL